MRRIGIILAAALATSPVGAQVDRDSEARAIFQTWRALDDSDNARKDYIEHHAPYGVDITPDGRVWVNLDATGAADDYAMLVDDILKGGQLGATVWVRGYHKRNPRVKYRTSMARYAMDCSEPRIQTLNYVTYTADGSVVSSQENRFYAGAYRTIVPGSVGETWWKVACRKI
jgi:hypothetical protein